MICIIQTISEKDFNSRTDALNWIIDNQLNRRNISGDQRTYLIGKRYKGEKKEQSRPKIENKDAIVAPLKTAYDIAGQNNIKTSDKIADQHNISPRTVHYAEQFIMLKSSRMLLMKLLRIHYQNCHHGLTFSAAGGSKAL